MRGWKEQKTGGNCSERRFWPRSNESKKTTQARRWASIGEQKKNIKVLVGKFEVKRLHARYRRGWKESRMGLKGTGIVWLRKRASGGLCEHGNEYSVLTNFEKKLPNKRRNIIFSKRTPLHGDR